MKGKVNVYSDDFKMQVVQEYLTGNYSQRELLKKYSIKGYSCISNWMLKFGLKEKTINSPIHMSKGNKKTAKELALEQKVKELEKALEYERLRTLALDTMIDIAEDKLKVSIRKKSGARQ